MPMGPAMLAVESGVPVYGMGVRRTGDGRYRGRLVPVDGPRRGHPARARHGDDDRGWPRRSNGSSRTPRTSGGRSSSRSGRTSRRRRRERRAAADAADEPGGRTRGPAHPHGRLRRDRGGHRRPRPRRWTLGLDVIAITDHERIDAAARRAGDRARPRPAARGHRRRGGHDPRRAPARARPDAPVRSYRSLRAHDRRDPRPGGAGHPGPPARALPAVRPGLRPAPPAGRPRRAVHPDALETFNPTSLGRPRHATRRPLRRPYGLAQVGNSDAHALDAVGIGWTIVPGPDGRRPAGGDRRRATRHHGTFHETLGQLGDVPRPAAQARSRRPRRGAGRVRSDGTGRDHGYPGGRQRPPRFEPGRTRRARHEDRPRLPVHLPGGRRRRPARPVPATRTCACAGHDVRIITASHGPQRSSEGDIIRARDRLLRARRTARSGR